MGTRHSGGASVYRRGLPRQSADWLVMTCKLSEFSHIGIGRLSAGCNPDGGQHGADVALVELVLLGGDLRLHHDPAPGNQVLGALVAAGNAAEGNIFHTAGHDEPAGGEHVVLVPAEHGHLGLEADGLAVVLLGLLGAVAIPQGVMLVLDLDDGRIDIEGQRIDDIVELGGAVGVIVEDVNAAVGCPGDLVEGHGVLALFQAVEDHHLGAHQLVHHQIAHIGVIGHEGGGVGEHDLLGHDPILGQTHVEVAHLLHAVELSHHTVGIVFLCQGIQLSSGDGLLVQNLQIHVLGRIGGEIKLLLAFLEQQDQGPLAVIEAGILQGLLDEFGLTGIQEAGEHIYRDLHHGLHSKQLGHGVLIQLGADDAELAVDVGAAHADVDLLGHHVEMDPGTVGAGQDALGAEHHAVSTGIQGLQGSLDGSAVELLVGLPAPGGEDLVGMMMVMVMAAAGAVLVVVVVMVVVLMVVAAAAVLVMIMVMMLMVMAAAAFLIVMMVMMLMLFVMVMTAVGLVLMAVMVLMAARIAVVVTAVVVMVVMVLMLLVVMMMVMLVVVAAAAFLIVMMVMMLVLLVVMAAAAVLVVVVVVMLLSGQAFHLHLSQFGSQGCLSLHGGDQLIAGQLGPGGGDDGGDLIVLPDHGNAGVQLGLGHGIGAGQDDGGCGLDLIVIELAKVLHVDLHLAGVSNGHGVAQGHVLIGHLVDSADNVGQLAHAGGLDDDAVGVILRDDLGQGLSEVAHQTAADAAGVHLGDVDASVLQEAAVDADLAELILDEDQLLALVGLLDHLLDQGRLAGTQETGVNVNFSLIRFTPSKLD